MVGQAAGVALYAKEMYCTDPETAGLPPVVAILGTGGDSSEGDWNHDRDA